MAEQREDTFLTRRGFIAALAASVVAAGAPLPVGVPGPDALGRDAGWTRFAQIEGEWQQIDMFVRLRIAFASKADEERARRECPALFAT